jgi:hypothetical protein
MKSLHFSAQLRNLGLNIALESLGRSRHRRVTTLTFAIKPKRYQTVIQKGKVPVKTEHEG